METRKLGRPPKYDWRSITKTCTKCDTTKPVTEFNARRGASDRLNSWCRVCAGASAKRSRTTRET